jgi:hypothetical protein
VEPGKERDLVSAINDGTRGKGSIAGDEYLNDIEQARVDDHGVASWVETAFAIRLSPKDALLGSVFPLAQREGCALPSEFPDEDGTEPWASCDCDYTKKLEKRLATQAKRLSKRFAQAKAISRSPRRTRDRRSLFTTLLALVWSFDIRIL